MIGGRGQPGIAAKGRPSTVPPGVIVVVVLFLGAVVYIIAASLTRREQPTYEPSPIQPREVPVGSTVVDTLTVDARHERAWRFVDFDRRTEIMPPDTAGWDVAVRRFHIIGADGIVDLGQRPFAAVVPPATGYQPNRFASDTTNPAIARWYSYSFMSHLLEPNGHVYAARTRDGGYAVIEILSYYCPGLSAGCVTLRYRYPVTAAHAGAAAAPSPSGAAPGRPSAVADRP